MKNLPFTITNVSVKFSVLKDLCFHCIVIVIVIVSNVVFVICFFCKMCLDHFKQTKKNSSCLYWPCQQSLEKTFSIFIRSKKRKKTFRADSHYLRDFVFASDASLNRLKLILQFSLEAYKLFS